MVDLGAGVCLAFPSPTSRGTWDCLKRAAKAGIHAEVWPITGAAKQPTPLAQVAQIPLQ